MNTERSVMIVGTAEEITLNEYQALAMKTAIYANAGQGNWIYPALALGGEAGEVQNKLKKVIRDFTYDGKSSPELTPDQKLAVAKELGGVLWYVAALAREIGFSLEDVASNNIAELRSRQTRGTISGSGDNR